MMKKILCAAIIATLFASCRKGEIIEESPLKEKVAIQLDISPYEIKTKAYAPITGQADAFDSIKRMDVFVFRDDGALEVYRSFYQIVPGKVDMSNIKIETSTGKKNIYVIGNGKKSTWEGISTEEKFLKETVSLKHEYFYNFTMSGKVSVDVSSDTRVQVRLKRIVSRVIIKNIKTNFASGPYSGSTLRDVKLYLTNVSGLKTYLGEDPETPVVLNMGGAVDTDVAGTYMTGEFCEEVPGLIGEEGKEVDYHFFCYENMIEEETADNKFTRLVMEAILNGKKYYYPVDINRPGYGWNSSIDHQGVRSNTTYTYNFIISGPGSDDPENKIVLKTISLESSVDGWSSSPDYSVSF